MHKWGEMPADVPSEIYRRVDVASLFKPRKDGTKSLQWPLPFKNGSVHEIDCKDVLQRVPDRNGFLFELYRICAPGALVRLITPYWSSSEALGFPPLTEQFYESLSRIRRAALSIADVPIDFEVEDISHNFYPEWEAI